jgi:hypothetical protein
MLAEYTFGLKGIAGALAMAEQKLRPKRRHSLLNTGSEWCAITCHRIQWTSPFPVTTLLNMTSGLVRDAI